MAKSSKKSIKPFRRLNNQPVARKNVSTIFLSLWSPLITTIKIILDELDIS